jgi:hypothetical protein
MIDLDHLIDLKHIKKSTQGAIVKSGREGPTVPVQYDPATWWITKP